MTRELDAIALAERVLSILEEGSFSATYRFALFTALLDLCIEQTSRQGAAPTTITTRQLAEKVTELYWNQSVPYENHGTLRQGGVRDTSQAEVVRRIAQSRLTWADSRTETPFRAHLTHPREFRRLLDFVEWKLIEMPIPRLQVLGGQEDRFLYEYHWTQNICQSTVSAYQRGRGSTFDNRLLLRPGVGEQLVRLNGVLRPLFHREWALMVASLNRLPQADLETFLFGAERVSLDAVREPLTNLQDGRCFYCDRRVQERPDVDHFVPWSRFPDDGLDNLVVAHAACNGSKRDFMAAAEHVERWRRRMVEQGPSLAALASQAGWRRDDTRTLSVARALYLRLPDTVRLWRAPSHFIPLERNRIERALV